MLIKSIRASKADIAKEALAWEETRNTGWALEQEARELEAHFRPLRRIEPNAHILNHIEICAANDGELMPLLAWEESEARNQNMRHIKGQMVETLARCAANDAACYPYTAEHQYPKKHRHIIGVVTGAKEEIPCVRRRQIFPDDARKMRKDAINHLNYYCKVEQQDGLPRTAHLRYGVISAGPRGDLPLGCELKSIHSKFCTRLRTFMRDAESKCDVHFILRSSEFTLADEGVNLHFNLLYYFDTKPTGEIINSLNNLMQQRFGTASKDCGQVESIEKITRYSFKPLNMSHYANDDIILPWLFKETCRMRLCEPLGEYQDWLKNLEYDGCKIASIKVELPDCKQAFRLHKAYKNPAVYEHEGDEMACEMEAKRIEERDRIKAEMEANGVDVESECVPENFIVAVTNPMPKFTPFFEPCIVIMNPTHSPKSDFGKLGLEILEDLRQRHHQNWIMNGGPANPEIALYLSESVTEEKDNFYYQSTNLVSSAINRTNSDSTLPQKDIILWDLQLETRRNELKALSGNKIYKKFIEEYRSAPDTHSESTKKVLLNLFKEEIAEAKTVINVPVSYKHVLQQSFGFELTG